MVEVRNDYRNVRAYISFVLSSTCLLIHLFICYFICLSIRLISFTFFLSIYPSIHSPKYRMFHQLSYPPLQPFIHPARLHCAFRQTLFQTRPVFDVRLWWLTKSGYIDWHDVIDTRELVWILSLRFHKSGQVCMLQICMFIESVVSNFLLYYELRHHLTRK